IRQGNGFQGRRREERRWPRRGRHYRGPLHQALRQGHALGPPRHRRHGDGLAANRDKPIVGLRVGGTAPRPPDRRQLRTALSEVLFYQLDRRPLERVLPELLEKCLERSWRTVIQVGSEERLIALDAHLWTYAEESFLPHGTAKDGHSEAQPVYLTTGGENPN